MRFFLIFTSIASAKRRIERVAQAVPEQIETQHQKREKHGRKQDDMRESGKIRLPGSQQRAYARQISGRKIDNAEITEIRFRINHPGNHENAACDQRAERVRKNMLEHQPSVLRAERARRQNVFLIFITIKLHTRCGGDGNPARQEKRDEQNQHLTA